MTDFATSTLGELGEAIIGLTYSPTQVSASGTLVLRSSNIQGGQLSLADTVFVDAPIPDKLRVRESDILICVRNGSRPLIGKSLYLDERVRGETFGAFMTVYRSPLNSYLRFFFQSDSFKRQVDEHLGATINQITNRSLRGFKVAYPGAAERDGISSRLLDIDDLVTSLGRLIAKKREIKLGMMQGLLTGRERLPGFDAHWQVVKLSDVTAIDPESLAPSAFSRSALIDYISLEDVSQGRILRSVRLPFGRAPSRARRRIQNGDVLFGTVRPNLQSHALYSGGLQLPVASTGFAVIRPRRSLADPAFLAQWVVGGTVTAQIERLIAGSNYPAVSSGDVRKLELHLPPYDEQVAIGAVLSDADREILSIERQLEVIRNIKQGMMQELLSGRTRIGVGEVSE